MEDTWSSDDVEVVGVLAISYDHHQRDLVQRIMDVQHRQFVHVLCTTHVHLDHHYCLETIIIRGRPAEIEGLSLEIGGMRGVRYAKLIRASKVAL